MKEARNPVGSRLARWLGLAVSQAAQGSDEGEERPTRQTQPRPHGEVQPLFSLNRNLPPLPRGDAGDVQEDGSR